MMLFLTADFYVAKCSLFLNSDMTEDLQKDTMLVRYLSPGEQEGSEREKQLFKI